MTKDQRIVRSVAAVYALHKKKAVAMLNAHGAKITPSTSNEKAIKTLKGFLTSNEKFAKEFITFAVEKGYLLEKDLIVEGSLEGYKAKGEFSNFYDALISGGMAMVGDIFKKPEADQATIQAIMELESKKLEAQQQSNAKYYVAGAAVLGLLVITGIIIYKKSK